MADIVRMPKMSDTMTEGVMAKWHKKVGDKVKSGDVLAEVETDKATMDLESYWDGTLLYIGVEEGKAVPIDAVIAVIGKEGEDYKAALEAEGGNAKADAPKAEAPKEEAKAEAPAQGGGLSEEELSKKGVTVIRMPLLSDTMTEGVIAEWHKKVGDKVKDDDILADVETDKATMEVMGYATGTLLHIGVNKGEAAKVNGIIAIVGPEGTDISGILTQGDAPAKAASAAADAPKAAEAPQTEEKAQAVSNANGGRIIASPLAKKIAKDKGIDLSQVAGSAEGGRIIKKDVENFKPSQAESAKSKDQSAPAASAAPAIPTFVGEEKFSERPVTQMRKAISRRLSESLFTAPHFYVTMSIDMDQAIAARAKMNDFAPVKISFNDLVVKAVAIALKQHPAINSSFQGDTIRTNEHVHIGVAVAVDEGLLVPVIRFADGKSLSHISAEVKDFAGKAKAKKLQPAEMEGSTFTISNLGMFGVDEFTAIINTPNACILAVSGISQVPVVKNGAVVPGNIMKVTLSCDHRVVDGATGAAFLQTLKSLLEEPVRLLV
ncbi:2-oxo acid dehydrogenase subunit E2 [Pedobacter sp. KR3-3]|uniref:Dihydrolipoamide acetyltransferase component of pyruvate dehydrogenase complex n=1 Tax=Pedobacter albus TaxID=3113905 RepID=A0ABU7IA40_9SPHI|nr:2-oxo acid dehydrogenase subunit E2 [Pedobacter sp. KR3-3]MEE1946221.1 2-oxo acid dehydrogenase subunit E2 [Pedobacter sp. KR3-3]